MFAKDFWVLGGGMHYIYGGGGFTIWVGYFLAV
jgi:hypothetical protein